MRTLSLVLASSCVLTRRRTAGRKFSRSLRLMSSADVEPPFEIECPKERRKLVWNWLEPATAVSWMFATADATSDRVESPEVPKPVFRRGKEGVLESGPDPPPDSSETSFSSTSITLGFDGVVFSWGLLGGEYFSSGPTFELPLLRCIRTAWLRQRRGTRAAGPSWGVAERKKQKPETAYGTYMRGR